MSKLMRKTRTELYGMAIRLKDRLPPDTHPDLVLPVDRLVRYHSPTKTMLIAAIEVMDYVLSQSQSAVHT